MPLKTPPPSPPARVRSAPARFILPIAAAAVSLVGCGTGEEFPTAEVSGVVMHNGTLVNGGSLTFAPLAAKDGLAGKPASGVIQEDGSFVLSTYRKGAVRSSEGTASPTRPRRRMWPPPRKAVTRSPGLRRMPG